VHCSQGTGQALLPHQGRGVATTACHAPIGHILTMVAGGSLDAARAAKLRICIGSQASKLNKVIVMSLIECCIHIHELDIKVTKNLRKTQK
jgi:hypothetical protein